MTRFRYPTIFTDSSPNGVMLSVSEDTPVAYYAPLANTNIFFAVTGLLYYCPEVSHPLPPNVTELDYYILNTRQHRTEQRTEQNSQPPPQNIKSLLYRDLCTWQF